MIYKHLIQSLTDDELSVIIYGINTYFPPLPIKEIDEHILSYYKGNILKNILLLIKDKLKEEYQCLIDSSILKLKI